MWGEPSVSAVVKCVVSKPTSELDDVNVASSKRKVCFLSLSLPGSGY